MRLLPISNSNYSFCANKRNNKSVDRAVTVKDLYDMEDRINAKIENQGKRVNNIENNINNFNSTLVKDQNKILGQALIDISKLIYFRPLAGSHDYYKTAIKSTEILKNDSVVK